MKNSTTNNLTEILTICFKNNIEFTYQKEEGENYITYVDEPSKLLTINIIDSEDENLEKMIHDKLLELQQLFKN